MMVALGADFDLEEQTQQYTDWEILIVSRISSLIASLITCDQADNFICLWITVIIKINKWATEIIQSHD